MASHKSLENQDEPLGTETNAESKTQEQIEDMRQDAGAGNDDASNKLTDVDSLLAENSEQDREIKHYFQRADDFGKEGDHKKVIVICKEILKIDPRNVKAYYYLGHSLWRLGYVKQAMECCKRALKISPGHKEAELLMFRMGWHPFWDEMHGEE